MTVELSHDTAAWLDTVGYRYHAFLSWPNTRDEAVLDCAERLKGEIESRLSHVIPDPRVFLNTDDIPPGDAWPESLKDAICRSVTMVALLTPVYCSPTKRWCGLEWAAMERLGDVRLPEEDTSLIIPVWYRSSENYPDRVTELQRVNMTEIQLRGRHYYRTHDYRGKVENIVERISEVSTLLHDRDREPRCDEFTFPDTPAFESDLEQDRRVPLIGGDGV